MRLFINGIEINNPQNGLNILAVLDSDTEMGPVNIRIEGGKLEIKGYHALTIISNAEYPWLTLTGSDVDGIKVDI